MNVHCIYGTSQNWMVKGNLLLDQLRYLIRVGNKGKNLAHEFEKMKTYVSRDGG